MTGSKVRPGKERDQMICHSYVRWSSVTNRIESQGVKNFTLVAHQISPRVNLTSRGFT